MARIRTSSLLLILAALLVVGGTVWMLLAGSSSREGGVPQALATSVVARIQDGLIPDGELVSLVDNPSPDIRIAAARAIVLHSRPLPGAFEGLLRMAADPNPEVNLAALRALPFVQPHGERARTLAQQGMRDGPSPEARWASARLLALVAGDSAESATAVFRLLKAEKGPRRTEGIKVLSEMQVDPTPWILPWLMGEDPALRNDALTVFSARREPGPMDALPFMPLFFDSPDTEILRQAWCSVSFRYGLRGKVLAPELLQRFQASGDRDWSGWGLCLVFVHEYLDVVAAETVRRLEAGTEAQRMDAIALAGDLECARGGGDAYPDLLSALDRLSQGAGSPGLAARARHVRGRVQETIARRNTNK